MAPVGNISLFKRFFGLAENYPLYAMVGIACGLAVYMPIRHNLTASDLAWDTKARDFGDDLAGNKRYLEKAGNYWGGPLAWVAHLRPYGPYVNAHPEYLQENRKWKVPSQIPSPQ